MPCAICRSATTGSRLTVSTRSIKAASLSHKASQRSSGALAARASQALGLAGAELEPGAAADAGERQPAQHGAERSADGAVACGLDLAGHRHGGTQAAGIVAAGGKRFEKRRRSRSSSRARAAPGRDRCCPRQARRGGAARPAGSSGARPCRPACSSAAVAAPGGGRRSATRWCAGAGRGAGRPGGRRGRAAAPPAP